MEQNNIELYKECSTGIERPPFILEINHGTKELHLTHCDEFKSIKFNSGEYKILLDLIKEFEEITNYNLEDLNKIFRKFKDGNK